MKWINKTGTELLDLDRIGYWKYQPVQSARDYNELIRQKIKEGSDGAFYIKKEEISILEVYIGSDSPLVFKEEDADEIYNILISKKNII